MGDVILFVDDLSSNSSISQCRICHEEEFESFKSLEAPCGCSGTVKVKCFFFSFNILIFRFWLLGFLCFDDLIFFIFLFDVSSLLTEIVYRGGVMRRETQLVKFVFRFEFLWLEQFFFQSFVYQNKIWCFCFYVKLGYLFTRFFFFLKLCFHLRFLEFSFKNVLKNYCYAFLFR